MNYNANKKFLIAHVGLDKICIPIDSVLEIAKGGVERVLPGTIDGFVGITRLRNSILGVMALNNSFKPSSDMVIVKTAKTNIALLADQVQGIEELPINFDNVKAKGFYISNIDGYNILDVDSIERAVG